MFIPSLTMRIVIPWVENINSYVSEFFKKGNKLIFQFITLLVNESKPSALALRILSYLCSVPYIP